MPIPNEKQGQIQTEMADVTNNPPVTSELDEWLSGISTGEAETIVTSEGKGWSFNCDGTAHYLQGVDVTRREPNGRYKRVYKGKIEGGHVTHYRVTSDIPCPSQYERWANIRHVTCKIQDRKSTRLNSSHIQKSRMPSSA